MKTLIKLNNSLILVSDETPEKDDNYIDEVGNIGKAFKSANMYKDCRKVLSQSPILSKEVADEISWIDVEELADVSIYKWLESKEYQTEYEETGEYKMYFSVDMPKILNDFIKDFSFQKAQKLNQKKYSEEDLRKAFDLGGYCGVDFTKKPDVELERLIISLSQPQQWQVEAEEIDGLWTVTKLIK